MSKQSAGSKVRYAVVGLGHIAQAAVLPAFKNARNSEIVALVSGDPRSVANSFHQIDSGDLVAGEGDLFAGA
jgi:predicted dehydrogenase